MMSQFEIYTTSHENRGVAVGKPLAGKPLTTGGRKVLGEIKQATRIQPHRAAKTVIPTNFKQDEPDKDINQDDKENKQAGKAYNQADKENIGDDKENLLDDVEKNHLLQDINAHHLDDSCVSITSEWDDVPMSMDISCTLPPSTEDSEDYLTAPEYSEEIYLYLRDMEKKTKLKWDYMSKQTQVSHNMRSILVDWLVEVATEYKLLPETLHLAISFIDRFMSVMSVQKSKLQLVGITAMLVAAKVEEIYPPTISEFIYITDDSYTKKQILRMEVLLLKVLEFDLSLPTSFAFLNQYIHMFGLEGRCASLATYLNELSLLDGDTFLRFPPSILAACSLALAQHSLGETPWTEDMAARTGHSSENLNDCFLKLHAAFVNAEGFEQQSIQDKYRSSKFHNVSNISPRDIM